MLGLFALDPKGSGCKGGLRVAKREPAKILRIALCLLLTGAAPSASSWAQSAATGFPPSNLEMRTAEFGARQQRQQAAQKQLQESRVRRLTGSGQAAGTSEALKLGSGAVTAGRIAVQAMIGATIAAALSSAGTEDAGLLAEISSSTASIGASTPAPEAGGSSSTTSSTSTSTSSSTATQ